MLRTHITPDMRDILEAIDSVDDPYDIPELTPILADAMEECGHPWAAAMREIAREGKRPYSGCEGTEGRWGWRALWVGEAPIEWAIHRDRHARLEPNREKWKAYHCASMALLALAKAMTEDVP